MRWPVIPLNTSHHNISLECLTHETALSYIIRPRVWNVPLQLLPSIWLHKYLAIHLVASTVWPCSHALQPGCMACKWTGWLSGSWALSCSLSTSSARSGLWEAVIAKHPPSGGLAFLHNVCYLLKSLSEDCIPHCEARAPLFCFGSIKLLPTYVSSFLSSSSWSVLSRQSSSFNLVCEAPWHPNSWKSVVLLTSF